MTLPDTPIRVLPEYEPISFDSRSTRSPADVRSQTMKLLSPSYVMWKIATLDLSSNRSVTASPLPLRTISSILSDVAPLGTPLSSSQDGAFVPLSTPLFWSTDPIAATATNATMSTASAATRTFPPDRFLPGGDVWSGGGPRDAPQEAQNEAPSCTGALHLGQFRHIPPNPIVGRYVCLLVIQMDN